MTISCYLYGGWGHDNIGDDLILDSYLRTLQTSNAIQDVCIISANPSETQNRLSQELLTTPTVLSVAQAIKSIRSDDLLIVCGGGYLNGSWRFHCTRKIIEIGVLARKAGKAVVHSVEISNLRSWQRWLITRVLKSADEIRVRDSESRNLLISRGLHSTVSSDAITLATPVERTRSVDNQNDYVLINLTDIEGRGDKNEAEFTLEDWALFEETIKELATRKNIKIVCAADYENKYVREKFNKSDVVYAGSVDELERLVANARAVIATRMHIALAGIRASKPTAAIAYNSKVRRTLHQLNLEHHLHSLAELNALLEEGAESNLPFCKNWRTAYTKNREEFKIMLTGAS